MRKRLLFVVPVAAAALSLSAATAFADAPPANQHGGSPPNCATAKQATQAKLHNDQAALDAARAHLNDANRWIQDNQAALQEGHQPWRLDDQRAAQAEVANLEAVVQADQAGLNQTPDVCKSTTGTPTTNTSKPSGASSSGASSSGASPRVPSDGPGLPQTGARG